MTSFVWPAEGGWPYPDGETGEAEMVDLSADIDDDLMSLRAVPPHLFDDLDPLERRVVTDFYGLAGRPARSMQQLQLDLGVPTADLQTALGAGLGKLRTQLR